VVFGSAETLELIQRSSCTKKGQGTSRPEDFREASPDRAPREVFETTRTGKEERARKDPEKDLERVRKVKHNSEGRIE
jgi:hypothetical protein